MRAVGRVIAVGVGDGQHWTLQQPQHNYNTQSRLRLRVMEEQRLIQYNTIQSKQIQFHLHIHPKYSDSAIFHCMAGWRGGGQLSVLSVLCWPRHAARTVCSLYHGLTRPGHGADMGQPRDNRGLPDYGQWCSKCLFSFLTPLQAYLSWFLSLAFSDNFLPQWLHLKLFLLLVAQLLMAL